jgi:dTDP-4-amino-4,6-dideoxygalactose transaminase
MDSKMDKQNPKMFSPWPYFGDEEIHAVESVLRSGRINQWTGSEVISFEKEYADYVGVKYAVAVANGSVALDIALAILGIGHDDEVIVTPRSFMASVGCVALKGATPVFVDVDHDSQNITSDLVKDAISSKTKAVIAVHLAGWPCELHDLSMLCDQYGIYMIEDCAQAHGAKFNGKHVGNYGHISAFSFCQDKIMTTGGEGGMLVTNTDDLWRKAWSYKDHGKDYNSVFNEQHSPGFRWLVKSFGTNYRMLEIQAAIGRVMLKRLDEWVKRRRMLAAILTDGFKEVPELRVTVPPDHIYHSYYKYYVFVRPDRLKDGWNRDRILDELGKRGVPCGTGACPEMYLEEAFKNYHYKLGSKNYELNR